MSSGTAFSLPSAWDLWSSHDFHAFRGRPFQRAAQHDCRFHGAASRWQTVWRVVLPSASPGIFAAVMIGFGRAVGETMVFLMATGNTPLIDLSPFNGMRTLSANIAEEIPGAPLNGTLYRTLFLCAVILFIMTFFLNTIAEVVRQHLRKHTASFRMMPDPVPIPPADQRFPITSWPLLRPSRPQGERRPVLGPWRTDGLGRRRHAGRDPPRRLTLLVVLLANGLAYFWPSRLENCNLSTAAMFWAVE